MKNALRKNTFSGSFYSKECTELKHHFKKFDTRIKTLHIKVTSIPKAVIVPHAGYIYSGFTAALAYTFCKKSKAKRVIVIGPSHHFSFKGISGSYYEAFETPCSNIEIDSAYLFALAKKFNIGFKPQVHTKEHSTEVQMPMIQHYLSKKKVIELIYGDISVEHLSNMLIALLNNPDNLLVISSDLSHFHTQHEAKKIDYHCLKAIEEQDVKHLKRSCEACGILGMKALILATKKKKFTSKILKYSTSAHANNNENSVVGYMSAIFY